MHKRAWLVGTVAACLSHMAVAQPTPAPNAPKKSATPAAGEVTTAYGKIPDSLAGTWLVVLNMKVGERYMNGWEVYKITHQGEKWQLHEFHGTPTTQLQQEIDAANSQGVACTPSAAVLSAPKDLLPRLQPVGAASRATTVALRAPGHFVEGPIKEPRYEWAKLLIELLAKGQNVSLSGQTYFVREITQNRLTGENATGQVAHGYGGVTVP